VQLVYVKVQLCLSLCYGIALLKFMLMCSFGLSLCLRCRCNWERADVKVCWVGLC
jgi:hypothetical protein